MRRKVALVLLSAGIALFALGFFVAFFYMEGLKQGWHVVKADGTLVLSWYLQRGDRTEGGFQFTGGTETVIFIVKNPSGVAIKTWYSERNQYYDGFTAQETGMYSMIFQNLDSINDKSIYVGFRSPYEPRVTIYDAVGWLMMLGSGVILFFGAHSLSKS